MFVYFRNGMSVWLKEARVVVAKDGVLIAQTSRGRTIAELQLAHVAFWCFDSEHLTTYGFADKAGK